MDSVQLPNSGDQFLGRWTIEGEVGKGGFSVVYRATDAQRRVSAIKILLPEVSAEGGMVGYDDELAERFLREARLLEQLDSPYTIRMYEFGQSPGGLFYMIFEFIDGRTVFDEIKTGGAMHHERVVHCLRQTLIGLQSAHKLGILHRDIKPNNIMLFGRDGDADRVKLVDFGIAKMFGEAKGLPGMDLTAAGLLVGTPRYMSPEQLRNGTLGPPSDLYSLGLCALEMLTGRKCIPGKDRMKIVEMQLRTESFVLPPEVQAPQGLKAIVHKLVEKNLHARYRSAAEALRDLEALAGDPGTTGDTVYQSIPANLEIPATVPKNTDEETVLHRVNTSELDALIAHGETLLATVKPGELEPTIPGRPATADDQTVAATVGSGQFQQPAQFRSSPSGAHQSGQFAAHQPGQNQPSHQSGLTQMPPQNHPQSGFGQPVPPGFGAANGGMGTPGAGGPLSPVPEKASKLQQDEILALAASFLLPGVGHLLLGQSKKGFVALAGLVLTLGIGWILLAPAATIDAFLVIRARRRRSVGEMEFFPDFDQLL